MSKKLILVGTFHFEQHEDILQKKKQEIEQLVDFLAEYHPTKIALEWESSSEDELNTAYLHSDGQYTKDEIQQIGFRLAKSNSMIMYMRSMMLERLHKGNWTNSWPLFRILILKF